MNFLKEFRTEVKIFFVGIILAILLIGGILLFAYFNKLTGINPIASARCRQIEQEMDTLIKQANYCAVDEDCIVSSEAAHPDSCWGLANKNTDITSLQEKRLRWHNLDCSRGRVSESCAPVPHLTQCQENKCVGMSYTPVQLQELKQNPSGWQQKIVVEGIYRWGLEDSNFDETADSREYNIWVEATSATQYENLPSTFIIDYLEGNSTHIYPDAPGSAQVTIYGTFDAIPECRPGLDQKCGFGYLSMMWKHQIVADKIVFHANTVIVSTDKDTYSREEDIIVTVQNTLESDIWIGGQCGFFDLLKKNGDEWGRYSSYPTKDCIVAYQQINPFKEREIVANLRDMYEYKYFVVVPGVYKLELKYALSNPLLIGGKIQFFDAFSNEFEVKD